ncbi:hypothetical protein BU14_2361s0001 [Porphyra umbilicalis]|uniref:Thioredoxin domain-containing protein n=1 Tax=Porphyra umbilicalis TaxID=2786 RepID=A0A1X6NJP9_PORUM|nr:hypothetical protein BU14_2361s0001 [Porphyra umbilicalis]|eukprot:OSX68706.1 hypothetical protein BU14_2361s0001 [Porphyra umbilicalis]
MKLSAIDLFRKVPRDLTHGTSHGGVLSVLALSLLGLLFFFETWTYLAGSTATSIILDDNADAKLQINFALTFLELPCSFATVEVWDYFGNNRLDVTADVRKTRVAGRHGEYVTGQWTDESGAVGHVEPRVAAGIPAPRDMPGPSAKLEQLSAAEFDARLAKEPLAFVAFLVAWCGYCRSLAPTWLSLASQVGARNLPVKLFVVDCVSSEALCAKQKVRGYPTMRLYHNGAAGESDYAGERSVDALAGYVREHANLPAEVRAATVRVSANEGCSLTGTLWVHRVPGAFHVIAKSDAHTFDAANTNTSHLVQHLSFGAPLSQAVMHRVPRDVAAAIQPLDGRGFVNRVGAHSHEHYIKVVSTHYRQGTLVGTRDVLGYQQSVSSMMFNAAPAVPEAKFSYDLSPTAVVIQQAGRRWYDFLTNLVAILGGAFTVFGLLDGAVYRLRKGNRKGVTSPLSVKSPPARPM